MNFILMRLLSKHLSWKKCSEYAEIRSRTRRCDGGKSLQNIPITEYSPKKIKMAITGNGNASKEQVAGMLQNLLN
jgi:hypothetical protein